ncbi:MAG: serine/threonine-protein kinase, partial [Bacteroidota bacterium]
MIGQTILQYKIIEKLGEGGMGIVYKAEDTKLNRIVALKFLPDRVNNDETAKARFFQEAQAAAGLNHPNICTIFGVEELDGKLFMSMEYVEGGTLANAIPFKKIDDAITIAAQIGDALQEAHTKGIVHRDIKADNIMLSSKGQAKVMDFGLAKLKGAMKLTRTSSTVGTLGYMAPEQIQGGEVDHRSDIFSFGVLLFEMLAGRLPFRGEHEAAMVYSIVNEEPQNIAQLVPDLSPIVVNLIHRCLEKDPAERYQHFDDITADLKRALRKTSKVMRSTPAFQQSAADLPAPSSQSTISTGISSAPLNSNAVRFGLIAAGAVIVGMIAWFT